MYDPAPDHVLLIYRRYQCLLCTGLDLCERCEACAEHAKEDHPVAKITDPSKVPQWLGLSQTELTF